MREKGWNVGWQVGEENWDGIWEQNWDGIGDQEKNRDKAQIQEKTGINPRIRIPMGFPEDPE